MSYISIRSDLNQGEQLIPDNREGEQDISEITTLNDDLSTQLIVKRETERMRTYRRKIQEV